MSEDQFVGCKVKATLTSGVVVTGTVFTYDSKNCSLVILENPTSERPNVKMLNTCFVSNVQVLEKDPKDPKDKLPPGVAQDVALPTLAGAGNENLPRKLNKTLQRAEDRRRYDSAKGAMEDLTIAACQLFDKLAVACGNAVFSTSQEHLAQAAAIAKANNVDVGSPSYVIIVGEVLVTDNGGAGGVAWNAPLVGEAREGSDAHGVAKRVKQACAAAFK